MNLQKQVTELLQKLENFRETEQERTNSKILKEIWNLRIKISRSNARNKEKLLFQLDNYEDYHIKKISKYLGKYSSKENNYHFF